MKYQKSIQLVDFLCNISIICKLFFRFADPKIVLLGLVQAFFEGSMYTFVLKWTPALTPEDNLKNPPIPHGVIFASFMVVLVKKFAVQAVFN